MAIWCLFTGLCAGCVLFAVFVATWCFFTGVGVVCGSQVVLVDLLPPPPLLLLSVIACLMLSGFSSFSLEKRGKGVR